MLGTTAWARGMALVSVVLAAQSSDVYAAPAIEQAEVTCPEGFVFRQCGTPCPTTCDNYGEQTMCIKMCKSGCFCPSDKILDEITSSCVDSIAACSNKPLASGTDADEAHSQAVDAQTVVFAVSGMLFAVLCAAIMRCVRRSAAAPKVVARPTGNKLKVVDLNLNRAGASPEEVSTQHV
ncbi:von Willebrand factor [Hondaea fermentalgiana]|uniref:von Willebrand factor n=1 Tax=Hondaea fermentalgiana TaxID=2315210 RepID=A0A2R5GQ14_9STRA|nr:von Willebrand factor [Hondaea fermentalgiana]|eukprot:GBG31868.1 von Willebrand factor [Hondaea fermentalgiana]